MRVTIKLIFFFLLSSLSYSKVIINTVSVNYLFGEKFYSYQKKIKLDFFKLDRDNSALTIVKSANNRVIDNSLEITFKVSIRANRDISDLIIADEIAKRFSYQNGTLLLNGVSPKKFRLLDSALSIPVGDVKKGESYILTYVVRVN
jgi:hypothetical protein